MPDGKASVRVQPPAKISIARALRLRCPQCGKGRLFAGYLKPVERCSVCGESYCNIRADDGPAWLTILLVGHILAPVLLLVLPHTLDWPMWISMTLWPSVGLVLMFLILPRAKGLFIALIWRTKCTGAG